MADENPDVTEEQQGGGKFAFLQNKAVVLGAIVVVQTLLAVGLTQFVILPRMGVQGADMGEQPAEELAAAVVEPGTIVGLEEIIVTLASDPRQPRYLRINVSLEIIDAATAERAAARTPQLRDIVIMILSSKSAEDLATPEGKAALRDEIFRDVSSRLPEGALMNVFFSDLVVQ
jgi:flagellar FliL protein